MKTFDNYSTGLINAKMYADKQDFATAATLYCSALMKDYDRAVKSLPFSQTKLCSMIAENLYESWDSITDLRLKILTLDWMRMFCNDPCINEVQELRIFYGHEQGGLALYARTLYSMGYYRSALKVIREIESNHTGNFIKCLDNGDNSVFDIAIMRADCYNELGKTQKAINYLLNIDNVCLSVDVKQLLAFHHRNLGDYRTAKRYADHALLLDNKSATSLFELGFALMNMNDPVHFDVFSELLDLEESDTVNYYKPFVFCYFGDREAALNELNNKSIDTLNCMDWEYMAAEIHSLLGNTDLASQHLTKALYNCKYRQFLKEDPALDNLRKTAWGMEIIQNHIHTQKSKDEAWAENCSLYLDYYCEEARHQVAEIPIMVYGNECLCLFQTISEYDDIETKSFLLELDKLTAMGGAYDILLNDKRLSSPFIGDTIPQRIFGYDLLSMFKSYTIDLKANKLLINANIPEYDEEKGLLLHFYWANNQIMLKANLSSLCYYDMDDEDCDLEYGFIVGSRTAMPREYFDYFVGNNLCHGLTRNQHQEYAYFDQLNFDNQIITDLAFEVTDCVIFPTIAWRDLSRGHKIITVDNETNRIIIT